MQKRISQPLSFIGKSLFWSVLLYIACMVVINWDEMSARFHHEATHIVEAHPVVPANPVAIIPVSSPQISDDDIKTEATSSVTHIVIEQLVKFLPSLHK